ncbi:hypothetical protein K440DRAFT_642510 [Wilcoxina mikolae CBS 423.85]|nr:hypothetical protein K440DRAFT_642510 [Wilcoxina mikolae CBS 423.85]
MMVMQVVGPDVQLFDLSPAHPFPVIDTKLTLRGCSDTLLPMLPPSRKKSSREHYIRTFKSLFNQTPSPPSTPLLPISNNQARFRVAFQARNGCAVLYLVELTEDGSGRDFIRALRAKRKEVMIPCTCKFVWKVVVETAIAEPINGADLEGQTPLEVNLRNSAPNPWLTHAFYNPETLGRAPNMTDFKVEGGSNLSAPMKTLVIKTVFNKPILLLLLMFAAVVACVIGILVGILTCRVDLGFGVACAVFALITAVQGLVVAYVKEFGGGGK